MTMALESGSAYIFDRNEGGTDNWGEVKNITASDGATGDEFGECRLHKRGHGGGRGRTKTMTMAQNPARPISLAAMREACR